MMKAQHWSMIAWCVAFFLATTSHLSAREIHVAKTGNNSAAGDQGHPYQTIQRAAEIAQPGDVVTVHEGTYRESVKPIRGGDATDNRIVYRVAVGEDVLVKGSEPIRTWTQVENGIWKAVLPNTFFGDYNPYALQVSGGWLNYGQWHHRGDVYLEGKAFYEKQQRKEIEQAEQSWYCDVDDATTTIWANCGNVDPNSKLTEINVRESLFMPAVTGLNYITLDGFQFLHAAANWAPPVIELQTGAIGPRMGKGWVIENCIVSDIRCVGIILGQAPGANYDDIDSFGDHIVRKNIIRRCGQAGIAGQRGAARCLIAENLIEDTNYRKEFGGWETAAIKFHQSVDTVIRGNLIRGVYHQIEGAFGIWMDFGNQGTRITGNIIYNTQAAAIFLEMDHGPTLVDNNIVVGGGFRSNSENTVLVHNLLVDCQCDYNSDTDRRSQYFTPHTTKLVGVKTGVPQNDKWFNNIFVRTGLSAVKAAPGFAADWNVYLEGATKSGFGDEKSLVDPMSVTLKIEDQPLGAMIRFEVNATTLQLEPPLLDAETFGVFPTVEQRLEDRDGEAIRVTTDLRGNQRNRFVVGPLVDLKSGENQVRWTARGR